MKYPISFIRQHFLSLINQLGGARQTPLFAIRQAIQHRPDLRQEDLDVVAAYQTLQEADFLTIVSDAQGTPVNVRLTERGMAYVRVLTCVQLILGGDSDLTTDQEAAVYNVVSVLCAGPHLA